MNYSELFNSLHPDFFKDKSIRSLPKEWIFTELVMDLRVDLPQATASHCPSKITFGEYHGDLAVLHDVVRKVDEGWVQYFNKGCRFYCAFDGEMIVSFCIIDDMGCFQGLHIGGPGCVGTIPEYRRQGIGLEMVRLATEIMRQEGFDISWIHYTHLANWYMKLGYKPVLRWNCDGIFKE